MRREALSAEGCDFDLMEADARRKAARAAALMEDMTYAETEALFLVALEYRRAARGGGHALALPDAMRRLCGAAAARLERFERAFADGLAV